MGALSPTRVTAGWVVGRVAVGVVAVMTVAGGLAFWNPWRLVAVERALAVPALAIVAAIVFGLAFALLPVPAGSRTGFPPGRRVFAALAVPVLSLQMWSLAVPGWPGAALRELARSPDGHRVVVLHRTVADRPCLSLWAGARIAGSLGDPGDGPVVTFDRPDLVVVRVTRPSRPSVGAVRQDGTFDLRLDPVSGRPLDRLPRPC